MGMDISIALAVEQGDVSVVSALASERWRLEYQVKVILGAFMVSLGSLRSSQSTKASKQEPFRVRKGIERLLRHLITFTL